MAYYHYCVGLVVLVILCMCNGQQADPGIMSHSVLQSKAISPVDYHEKVIKSWTPAKMRAARPIAEVRVQGKSNTNNNDNTLVQPFISIGSPDIVPETLSDNNEIESFALAASQTVVKTVGKLFITTSSGGSGWCSASVVSAPSGSLLVTAAHCAYDRAANDWFSDWMFVPAYNNGAEPFGRWSASYITMPSCYATAAEDSQWNCDVAFMVLNLNTNKQKISTITGVQNIAFNTGLNQPTTSFGYPANIASGRIMSSCYNKALTAQCKPTGYTGFSIRCGMTQGCSGGPWVQNFNSATGVGTIMSVNSFGCSNLPNFVQAPLFDNNIRALYDAVKTKAPPS